MDEHLQLYTQVSKINVLEEKRKLSRINENYNQNICLDK